MSSSFQVLHKSRCNNRLNEITERGSADKSEVFSTSFFFFFFFFGFVKFKFTSHYGFILQAESLGKKYEEKYKQVAEIASKLTIEEAKYRDVQVKIHLLKLYFDFVPEFICFFSNLFIASTRAGWLIVSWLSIFSG